VLLELREDVLGQGLRGAVTRDHALAVVRDRLRDLYGERQPAKQNYFVLIC